MCNRKKNKGRKQGTGYRVDGRRGERLRNKEERGKKETGRRGKEGEKNGDTHAVEKGAFEGVDNYD